MLPIPQPQFRVYDGPSLLAPFAAVVAEFSSPFSSRLATARVASLLGDTVPRELAEIVALPLGQVTFEHLVALLTKALQDLAGPCGLPAEVQNTDAGSARVVAGFYDPVAAMQACHTALLIAHAVFTRGATDADVEATATIRRDEASAAIHQTANVMRIRQPGSLTRSVIRAAHKRDIPVYAVSPGSGQWRYGQGSSGCIFVGAGNQRDSSIGKVLADNKFLSNQYIIRLGLPGVKHGLADTPEAAVHIAQQIGFPLVVKPIGGIKGRGISTNITNAGELPAAFAKASTISRGVLVERHVSGDDHRLAVFGGKLKWVVRRSPPRVVGNGDMTIAELIDLENRDRSDADVAAGFVKRLAIDDEMVAVLAKQGLTVDDRPAVGRSIDLRSVANTAAGGTIVDCTENVHPDNREMAETIARGFQLDALGIDFICTDIARSWREGDCAVIEVNSRPGFSSDSRAEVILADKFPPGDDGRLPSIVLIGADLALIERVTASVEALVKRVGQTDSTATLLAGQQRCRATDPLPARVLALLLDASCEALVIGTTPHEIERHGFPLDRCDLALIVDSASISTALRKLIDACANEVIAGVSNQNFDRSILASIASKVAENIQRQGG